MGVLLSSFAAGAIVNRYGLHLPFLLAAGGFVLTAVLDRLILNVPSAGHADDSGRAEAPANLEAPVHAN